LRNSALAGTSSPTTQRFTARFQALDHDQVSGERQMLDFTVLNAFKRPPWDCFPHGSVQHVVGVDGAPGVAICWRLFVRWV